MRGGFPGVRAAPLMGIGLGRSYPTSLIRDWKEESVMALPITHRCIWVPLNTADWAWASITPGLSPVAVPLFYGGCRPTRTTWRAGSSCGALLAYLRRRGSSCGSRHKWPLLQSSNSINLIASPPWLWQFALQSLNHHSPAFPSSL